MENVKDESYIRKEEIWLLTYHFKAYMIQSRLFSHDICTTKKVSFGSLSAEFNSINENTYDVILELNSNKFLITLTTDGSLIEEISITAIKGFIELGIQLQKLIKSILTSLYHDYYFQDY